MSADSTEHNGSSTDASVTNVITVQVRPGREPEFEEWLHGIGEEASTFQGHQGLTMLRPVDHSHPEYVVLVRFASYDDLRRWEGSTQRAEWFHRLEPLVLDSPTYRRQTGMETWFTLPGHAVVVPPPKHKMAVLAFLAVYPLVLIVAPLMRLAIGDFVPFPVVAIPTALLIVLLMTWVVMPLLMRFTRRWVFPTQ